MTRKEIIDGVKKHALDHYTEGGWDVLVECYTDEELDRFISDGVTTVEEAVADVEDAIDVWADRQADAINSVF